MKAWIALNVAVTVLLMLIEPFLFTVLAVWWAFVLNWLEE